MDEKLPLILVVDDNPENIQYLGNLLMANGYEVGVAQNGVVALDFCALRLPDLILLDVMMPEMDGYEFCTQLKADLGTSHIPVIFLTAKTQTQDIVNGFEAGGVDYVSKPFISAELLARVKTHVEMKQLRHLIPICSVCKKVRDYEGQWHDMETYVRKYSDSRFSHGMCSECGDKMYGHESWYNGKKKD